MPLDGKSSEAESDCDNRVYNTHPMQPNQCVIYIQCLNRSISALSYPKIPNAPFLHFRADFLFNEKSGCLAVNHCPILGIYAAIVSAEPLLLVFGLGPESSSQFWRRFVPLCPCMWGWIERVDQLHNISARFESPNLPLNPAVTIVLTAPWLRALTTCSLSLSLQYCWVCFRQTARRKWRGWSVTTPRCRATISCGRPTCLCWTSSGCCINPAHGRKW